MGMLFAASVTLLFNAAIAHMVKFPLEGAVILREYTSGANAIGPYMAAKCLADIPYALGPIIFSVALYWTAGLLSSWSTFWCFTAVAVLMAQSAMSMGVALACFSLDPSIGLTLLPVLTAPMVMFSGLLYERASVPPALAWMSSFSIINHGFALMLSLEAPALPSGQGAIVRKAGGREGGREGG
ncbi:abc transmembrane transporter, partial [Nannochloropsis gaditana]